jgi:hypothetical protein
MCGLETEWFKKLIWQKIINHLRQFKKVHLGVTPLRKGAYLLYRLFSPFSQRGRAIHATSVAYFYPSRSFTDLKIFSLLPNRNKLLSKFLSI